MRAPRETPNHDRPPRGQDYEEQTPNTSSVNARRLSGDRYAGSPQSAPKCLPRTAIRFWCRYAALVDTPPEHTRQRANGSGTPCSAQLWITWSHRSLSSVTDKADVFPSADIRRVNSHNTRIAVPAEGLTYRVDSEDRRAGDEHAFLRNVQLIHDNRTLQLQSAASAVLTTSLTAEAIAARTGSMEALSDLVESTNYLYSHDSFENRSAEERTDWRVATLPVCYRRS